MAAGVVQHLHVGYGKVRGMVWKAWAQKAVAATAALWRTTKKGP